MQEYKTVSLIYIFCIGFTVVESVVERMKREGLLEPSITKFTWIVKMSDSAVAAD